MIRILCNTTRWTSGILDDTCDAQRADKLISAMPWTGPQVMPHKKQTIKPDRNNIKAPASPRSIGHQAKRNGRRPMTSFDAATDSGGRDILQKTTRAGPRMTPSEILISACQTIARQSGQETIDTWVKASSLFCEVSGNPLADFVAAEEVLNEEGHSAVTTASTIASESFEWQKERLAFASILRLTNVTGLAALRFTAAWLAFNMNDFDACIAECEKIDDHGYHVHGLMGQAYLESGQPVQAINCFRVALAMNERDAAIWFQLAKASYVTGDLGDSWQSLESCSSLVGPSAEITVLQCAVACATCEGGFQDSKVKREKALQAIRGIYRRDPNKGLLLVYASKLAMFSGSEQTFIEEIREFHEFRDEKADVDASIVSTDIAEVLKLLQKKGWYKGAACLLSVLTNEGAHGQVKARSTEEPDGPASA